MAQRNRAERQAALAQSKAQLRALLDTTTDSIVLIDASGIVLTLNEAAARGLGGTPATITGTSVYDHMAPDLAAEQRHQAARVRETGTPARFEVAIDGRVFDSLVYPLEVPGSGGSCLAVFARDITAQQATERQLALQRDFADGLVAATPAAILVLGLDGTIQHVNPFMENLTGYTREEIVGKDWFNTSLPEEDRECIRELFLAATHDQPTRGNVNAILTKDGRRIDIEWNDQVIRNTSGEVTGLLAIGQDVTQRKQADAVLREGERRLRTIIDNMAAFVAVYEPDGTMVEVSQHTLDAWGLRREEMVGHRPWETPRWSARPNAQNALKAAFARVVQGERVRGDISARVAHGELVTDSSLAPLYGDDGRVTGILSFAVDITERKRAEAALRLNEGRLREAQYMAKLGNWQVDRVSGVLEWSDEFAQIYELDVPSGGTDYSPFLERIHPDDRKAVHAAYLQSVKLGEPYALNHRLLMSDGRVKYVRSQGETFRDEQGEPVRTAGTIQDISDQQRVAVLESQLAATLESLTDGFYTLDRDWQYTYVNQRAAEMVGIPREELIGKYVWDVFPGALGTPVHHAMEDAMASRQRTVWEQPYPELGLWFEGTVYPHPDGIAVYFVDISERKRSEQAIVAALRDRETLLREVHHRVKNNLAIVVELLGMQAARVDDPEVRATFVEGQNRIHAMALVHEMLYQSETLSAIDLRDHIERLCSQLFESYAHTSAPVRLKVDVQPIQLGLDQAIAFSLILNEMISNALKHAFNAGPGGRLEVSVSALPDGRIGLTVADNGSGLPEGFDTTRPTSLGIRLIQSLAGQLRGELAVESGPGVRWTLMFMPAPVPAVAP